MKNKIKFFTMTFLFASVAYAQNYTLNILVDNSSNKYIQSIKNETNSLFSSDDKINFNVNTCDNNCENKIANSNIVLLNSNKKFKNKSNKNIITYNLISTVYDENKIIRASALSIYEFLKEKKSGNSIFIQNKVEELISDVKNSSSSKIDLNDIFSFATKNNLQIKQNENSSKIDKLNIDESKTYYKPQVDFYSNLVQIDSDRAKYSSGLYSEGTIDVGLKVTQLIYSDKVLKNIKIKKLLDKSNINSIKAKNDEIIYKAVLTYLNIIKANKYNQIINIKQNFIKQNLSFSKQRVQIGVQDRSDVYRWESELANANIQLANSQKQLDSLKIELSNLLQIKKDFAFVPYGMNSIEFKLLNNDAIKYITNQNVKQLFLDEIIYTHSRLRQLDELIKAKNEEFKMNKSSRYLPTVVFEGNAKKIVDRYGTGSETTRYWDDKEYQAIINLTLPLYEGGAKSVNIEKNEIELVNLKLQYNDIKNLIEQNVEQNVDSLKKSYEKIDYSIISQNFSKKNYELIQDKYNNGKENIISLLDAQNSYIVSKLNENISIIDYLVDLSSIYFFSGNIDILVNKTKKEQLEQNILKAIK